MKFWLLLWLTIYASTSLAKQDGMLNNLLFSQATALQILNADNTNLRYATWSENSDVYLVVIKQKKITAKITIADAYQPNFREIVSWQYQKHPVLVLTYRQGAAAELVELYGINTQNELILLAQILGEQIEWRIGKNGETLLSVYTKPEGALIATCYQFDNKSHKLSPSQCD